MCEKCAALDSETIQRNDAEHIGVCAKETEFGIKCALPEAMVLANLLEHREFKDYGIEGTEYMGRPHKRRCKDLGRVLAISVLTEDIEDWVGASSASVSGQLCSPRERSEKETAAKSSVLEEAG